MIENINDSKLLILQSCISGCYMSFLYWLDNWLHPLCHKCNKGRVKHNRSEWTGNVWIEVYQCNKCKTEFI